MTDLTSPSKELQFHAGPHAVLMLHGLGAAPLELARLAQEAHQEGFSVRVPNIDGYCYGSPNRPWTHWRDQVLESPTCVVSLSTALGYDGWAIPWYHDLISVAKWIPFSHRYRYVEREPYGLKNRETRAMVKRMMQSQHISEVGAEILPLPLITEGKKLIRAVKARPDRIQSYELRRQLESK